MKVYYKRLVIPTTSRLDEVDITDHTQHEVQKSEVQNGMAFIFVPHNGAALTINEHQKEIWNDSWRCYQTWAPLDGNYEHHRTWGGMEKNGMAHVLSNFMAKSIPLLILNGRLRLGTWQQLLLWEMDGPRERQVDVMVMGE
ncbi:MAG: hypothetical protein AOA66_0896 [Candidatus Bathyarchaeota archaeon BA2]|nr:MAG: hypothetical protein AOA66_0896 [Candidatus Bathyarchaeota archaeon BA2]